MQASTCEPCARELPETIFVGVTSAILIVYLVFLTIRRSRRAMFLIVRLGTLAMVGCRLIDVAVYNREESQDGLMYFFVSALATVGAFIAAYQWALNIIEVSYKTVRISRDPPKWARYYCRFFQVSMTVVFFTLMLAFRATTSVSCGPAGLALTIFRFLGFAFMAIPLVACHVVVHKKVQTAAKELKLSNMGASEKFTKAVQKTRRIAIGVSIFAVVLLIAAIVFVRSGVEALNSPDENDSGCSQGAQLGVTAALTLFAFLLAWHTDVPHVDKGYSSWRESTDSSKTGSTKSVQLRHTGSVSTLTSTSGFSSSRRDDARNAGFATPRGSNHNGGFRTPPPLATHNSGFVTPPPVSPTNSGFVTPPSPLSPNGSRGSAKRPPPLSPNSSRGSLNHSSSSRSVVEIEMPAPQRKSAPPVFPAPKLPSRESTGSSGPSSVLRSSNSTTTFV